MVEPPNKHVNTILQESKNGETILFWHGVNLLFSLDYRVRKEAGGIVFISGGEDGDEQETKCDSHPVKISCCESGKG